MSITGGDVVDLGRGLHAWLPPKRGWGLANCGLLVAPRGALWIDTPYDPFLAGQFLVESRKRLPDGVDIGRMADVAAAHETGAACTGGSACRPAGTTAAPPPPPRAADAPPQQRRGVAVLARIVAQIARRGAT
ncbi:hypothetical protein ACFWBV_35560, partial [Streptomyces sp. NPDC060030]